jgi:hypothetical protein
MSVSYALNDSLTTWFFASLLVVFFSLIQSVHEPAEKLMVVFFFIYYAALNTVKGISIKDMLSSLSNILSIVVAILTILKKSYFNDIKKKASFKILK